MTELLLFTLVLVAIVRWVESRVHARLGKIETTLGKLERRVNDVERNIELPRIQFTNMPAGDVPIRKENAQGVRRLNSVPIKKVPAHFDLCKLVT